MNTESPSNYDGLDLMSTQEILIGMNDEDARIAAIVRSQISAITLLVDALVSKMQRGGRLFYMGAGTSGRLGIVDASECPPTFGVEQGRVLGIIAGGDGAIRKAVENAEDDTEQGFRDLQLHNINTNDVVVGIAASGRTPYVLGALQACRQAGITTGCIVCNSDSPVAKMADFPIELITGPEFLTGSTRLKAGTATKLALNMITTAAMIRLGRVKGNKMVDMQLSNDKLVDRGTRMIMEETGLDYDTAQLVLLKEGSVRAAIDKLSQW
jgi:N-acetylmuramic acid 6-phosphate etherase